jgi:hypothetical protein
LNKVNSTIRSVPAFLTFLREPLMQKRVNAQPVVFNQKEEQD